MHTHAIRSSLLVCSLILIYSLLAFTDVAQLSYYMRVHADCMTSEQLYAQPKLRM